MATTSKYFVLTPSANNLDFLDFDLSYGNGSITTVGESIQFNGSPMVDSVFVRPGLTYDLSSTAGSTDKIYFTGKLSDYQLIVNSSQASMTLFRNVGGLNESVTISGGTSKSFDLLVFADGAFNSNKLYNATANGTALPSSETTETSLAPIGAAAPGAHLEATIKAFSSNPAAAGQVGETFASVRPGINYIVNGGNGIDTIYVADGSKVDATVLGQSVDLIYMRGKWSDYTKSLETNDTVLLFTRQVNGVTESVKVDAGTSRNFDRLIFADGSVTTFNAKTAITSDPNVGLEGVAAYNPKQTTPLYSDAEVAAALATIRDAAEKNNATADAPAQQVYKIAGVTGVTADNLSSINSALDSSLVDGAHADTAPEVQAIVDAYNAILASADGKVGNTITSLTGDQYAAVGVTGVSGTSAPAAGSALHLLDDAVDRSSSKAVDTEPELQNLFDAAKAVQAQAAGTAGLTMAQLGLLGVNDQSGVLLGNSLNAAAQQAILATIASAADGGTGTDTVAEIQALVNAVNRAPMLDPSKTPTLGVVNTTVAIAAPEGAVGTLVSALVGKTGIANFSDADAGSSVGMVITGYNTDKGRLYYSTNGGTDWGLWTPSGNSALHLLADDNTRVYFRPTLNANGDPAIHFAAWDASNALTNGAIAAVTSTGGATAYSAESDTLAYTLQGVYALPQSNITHLSDWYNISFIANFNGDDFMDMADWDTTAGMGVFTELVRLGSASGITASPSDAGAKRAGGYEWNSSPVDFTGNGYASIAHIRTDYSTLINGNSAGTTTSVTKGAWSGIAYGAAYVAKGMGDYNGDGYGDLLSEGGSNYASGTQPFMYHSNLVYGNAAGTHDFDGKTASAGVVLGNYQGDLGGHGYSWYQGASTAWAGDMNRDGLSDVAFAVREVGTILVKYGSGTQVASAEVSTSTVAASTGNGFTITGLGKTYATLIYTASAGTTQSLSSAGDVNGDGYADLLVMTAGNNSAYVVYGKPNGSMADVNVNTMTAEQGFKISLGNTANSAWLLAYNGAGVGDLNADGYDDIVLGEPVKSDSGGAVVVWGAATHSNVLADSAAAITSGTITQLDFSGNTYDGTHTVVKMGTEIGSTAGDVNGDGLSDFVIGGDYVSSAPMVVYGDVYMAHLAANRLLQGSVVTGSTEAERLLGTTGNDMLFGGGGADALSSGAGNDTLLIHDASFVRVDGGTGVDTLKLDATASGVALNFLANGLGGKVYGMEGIDLTGGGNNSLTLTLQDILAQPNIVNTAATSFNESHLMVISGNAGDVFKVSSTASLNAGLWSAGVALGAADQSALSALGYQFVTGDSYTAYSNGLATILVDDKVSYQVI